MDTARPALLSAGLVIDEPEDNSASALLNALLDWLSNVAVFIAGVFVLITMLIMNSFLESPREGPFLSGTTSMLCWRAFIQAPAVFPSSRLWPPDAMVTGLYRRKPPTLK
jgi:hypothetical protein